MALELVNSNIGENTELLVPGAPVVFSLKSTDKYVVGGTINARLALSNTVMRVLANGSAVLPEADTKLVSTVAVETPERRRPINSVLPRMADGSRILIGPGTAEEMDAGIYEVTLPVERYSPVLASVTFDISHTWEMKSRYWSDETFLAPLYMGFEYGIRNSGLFVFPQMGGGLVVGGPLLAFDSARAQQETIQVGWDLLGTGTAFTVFFYVDETGQNIQLWVAAEGETPRVVGTFDMGALGEFAPESESFPQRRSGPEHVARLFFGNGGGPSDIVRISDFAIYPYAPLSIDRETAQPNHSVRIYPDLPASFFAYDRKLPTDKALGRWSTAGLVAPTMGWWFQPGRQTVPTYATMTKKGNGDSFLRRAEPVLEGRASGFSVEAWMAGSIDNLAGANVGFGIRVNDGQQIFQIVALEAELVKTYGIVKDPAAPGDVELGYHVVRDGATLRPVDYSALQLVRLTLDRARNELALYIEDSDIPFMALPMRDADDVPLLLPTPTNFLQPAKGVVDIGFLRSVDAEMEMKLGSISYLTNYKAWEGRDNVPPENSFTMFEPIFNGKNEFSFSNQTQRIEKSSFGAAEGEYAYYRYATTGEFRYQSGLQIDFRGRVVSYTDKEGTSNAPAMWTGAGVTVYFGTVDTPGNEPVKLHLGFFDCGQHGRKIAILPGGETGMSDILDQTELGKLYSADMAWMTMDSEIGSYRLVYSPGRAIEVWDRNILKDTPIISIPWDRYVPQYDPTDQDPTIAFGNFNSEVNCLSEWQYIRWGISSGREVELYQVQPDLKYVFGGRSLLMVDAAEGT